MVSSRELSCPIRASVASRGAQTRVITSTRVYAFLPAVTALLADRYPSRTVLGHLPHQLIAETRYAR